MAKRLAAGGWTQGRTARTANLGQDHMLNRNRGRQAARKQAGDENALLRIAASIVRSRAGEKLGKPAEVQGVHADHSIHAVPDKAFVRVFENHAIVAQEAEAAKQATQRGRRLPGTTRTHEQNTLLFD